MTHKLKRSVAFLSAFTMAMAMLLYFPSETFRNIDWRLTASAEGYDENGFGDNGNYQPAVEEQLVYDINGDDKVDENDKAYKIGNAGQLYWFAGLINGTLTDGTSQNKSANAVLTADITVNEDILNESDTLNSGSFISWTPIGKTYTNAFTGTFDGNNKTISGLYNNSTSSEEIVLVGLFGYVGSGGSVSNVGVVDSYFQLSGNFYSGFVGGVCGVNGGGIIENCYIEKSIAVTNSTYYCQVGGVCGVNDAGTIKNCHNAGKVKATGCHTGTEIRIGVGGVCGTNQDGTITNCYNAGEVTATAGGRCYVGGVCGNNYYCSGTTTITSCYNTGNVTATGEAAYVGGVSGQNYASYGGIVEITNCYNTGSVSGEDLVGGVSGYNCGASSGETSTITNCYNCGTVTATGENPAVGGVIGYNYDITPIQVTNCYYLAGCNADGTTFTCTEGTSKTTDEFGKGEVCYLLNGSQSDSPVWYQTLNNEAYPNLDNTNKESRTVYACTPCPSKFSNTEDGTEEHSYVVDTNDSTKHICEKCGIDSHNAEFTADDTTDTISVCCNLGSVTLTAPTEENLTYNGTAKAATIGDNDKIEGFETPDIVYNTADGSVPVNAGTYIASITYTINEVNYSVSVEFTIEKKELTVSAGTYKVSKVYDGTKDKGTGNNGAFEVDGLVGEDSVTINPGDIGEYSGSDAGNDYEVEVNISLSGDNANNYTLGNVTSIKVPAEITKAEQTAEVITPVVSKFDCCSVTLTEVDGYEYSKDGTTWQDSNVFTGLTAETEYTFYQRIKATANYEASANSTGVSQTTGEHDYSAEIAKSEALYKSANCTSPAVYYYSCSKCGDVEKDSTHTFTNGSALGHSYTKQVISNAAKVSDATCTSPAVYHYSCSRCGAISSTKTFIYGSALEHNDTDNDGYCNNGCGKLIHSIVKEVSATLDGDIGLNYYIALPESVTADTGAYVQFTVNGQDTKVYVKDVTDIEGSVYKFTCWLTAKEMSDDVTFKLYDGNGTLIDIYSNSGDKVEGASFDYSLETYLNTLSSDENAALKDLADATLVYGAYAQNAFNHNADPNLDGSELADVTVGTLEANKITKSADIPEGLKLTEMTLILETETTLRLYFKSDNIENYTFKLDGTGVTLNKIEEEGLYYVEIANISAKDLDTEHTLIINDNCELTFNALSYAYAVIKNSTNDNLCNVVKALYKYNEAANDYFGN